MRGSYSLYAIRYTLCLSVITLLSGCVVRSYSVTRDRVDQDLSSGNKGYLQGAGAESEGAVERKTSRTTQVVEIELHPPIKFEGAPRIKTAETGAEAITEAETEGEDRELWGNRGYITRGAVSQKSGLPTVVTKGTDTKKHIVQKGDTLQKISKKFYGTTKKWPKLYDANKDVLKGPNKLYPGQALVIPFDYSAPAVEGSVMQEPQENLK